MSANITPIFSKVGAIQGGFIKDANVARDGTGTVVTIFIADVTNGSLVEVIRFVPLGDNIKTVARLFINNGSTNSVPANNFLFHEVTLEFTSAAEDQALGITQNITPIALPPGYKINVALGTGVATGFAVTVFGGNY